MSPCLSRAARRLSAPLLAAATLLLAPTVALDASLLAAAPPDGAPLLAPSPTDAASPTAPPPAAVDPQGDEVSVYLLTIGPGDRIWEVWSHNALWIRNPARGVDLAYNWGVFDFDQENFLLRFVRGEMLYRMESYVADAMVQHYVGENRAMWAQELNLTARQKAELIAVLERTDTDENRHYRYDYYLDNCSTRIRDVLDAIVGGRVAAALDVETGVTWRWHTRRILQQSPAAYLGIHFGLGQPADEPITAWQESFLPLRLMEHLRSVTVPDEAGREVPLVARELEVFDAARPLPPEAPRSWFSWFLLTGLAVGAIVVGGGLAGLGARRPGPGAPPGRPLPGKVGVTSRGARAGLLTAGGLATLWSFVAGLAGVLFLLAWAFTDHTFWYRNENLLQASPVSLVLAALFVAGHLGRARAARWLGPVGLLAFGLAAVGFALQALPAFDQSNGEILALTLPVHAAVAWLAVRLGGEGAEVGRAPPGREARPAARG